LRVHEGQRRQPIDYLLVLRNDRGEQRLFSGLLLRCSVRKRIGEKVKILRANVMNRAPPGFGREIVVGAAVAGNRVLGAASSPCWQTTMPPLAGRDSSASGEFHTRSRRETST